MTSNAGSAAARDDGSAPRWTSLVQRIRAGDDDAVQELYLRLSNGLRILISRQLGRQDVHDRIHDVFIIVLTAIRTERLRDPESLIGFARAVTRHNIAGCIREMSQSRELDRGIKAGDCLARGQHSPEDMVLDRERTEIAYKALKKLRPRDREILKRFYLSGQTEEKICDEMHLTATQFRLAKSRAKAEFGKIGGRIIGRKPVMHAGSGCG